MPAKLEMEAKLAIMEPNVVLLGSSAARYDGIGLAEFSKPSVRTDTSFWREKRGTGLGLKANEAADMVKLKSFKVKSA